MGNVGGMGNKVERTEAEWRELLSPEEYEVLRQAGTERPWSGEYVSTETPGTYHCRACDAALFRSQTKFEAHCGWPAFYEPSEGDAVELIEDRGHGMVRTEVRCAACGSHLGHVFDDGPVEHGGQRYCINSVSLKLDEAA
jgi:peptide-methionine (R)-S-oxide reductase